MLDVYILVSPSQSRALYAYAFFLSKSRTGQSKCPSTLMTLKLSCLQGDLSILREARTMGISSLGWMFGI